MTEVCKCGRGAVSARDGKCGYCRTGKERKALQRKLYLECKAIREENEVQNLWRVTRQ